jgi:hypothetical protein
VSGVAHAPPAVVGVGVPVVAVDVGLSEAAVVGVGVEVGVEAIVVGEGTGVDVGSVVGLVVGKFVATNEPVSA